MSEEAAKQIDREALALRVAEAPQLVQGLASDAKIIGLVLPIPDQSVETLDPTLGTNPGNGPLLHSLSLELSWQSAMAELLTLVRLEGLAEADAPATMAGGANALELLLASSTAELAASDSDQPAPPEQANALRPTTPDFVDAAFGDLAPSVLSLQDRDLFGLESAPQHADDRADLLGVESGQSLDIDLFGGSQGTTTGLTSISKTNNPAAATTSGVLEPTGTDDGGGAAAAGISPGGTPGNAIFIPGFVKLGSGAMEVLIDQQIALENADAANNLSVFGDGDDIVELVGDWVLVSEDPVKSVSVYAYTDASVSVVAHNVEVVLA